MVSYRVWFYSHSFFFYCISYLDESLVSCNKHQFKLSLLFVLISVQFHILRVDSLYGAIDMESSNGAAGGEQSIVSDAAEQQLLRQEAQNLEDIAATFRYTCFIIHLWYLTAMKLNKIAPVLQRLDSDH